MADCIGDVVVVVVAAVTKIQNHQAQNDEQKEEEQTEEEEVEERANVQRAQRKGLGWARRSDKPERRRQTYEQRQRRGQG